MIRRFVCLITAALSFVVVFASPAAAHDCSSDADCEQTGGYNGAIAVVGGIAAVAAAAVAAVAKTPEGEETDLSILQLDKNEVDIDDETEGVVTLTGWHVGKDGQPKRVPMTIWIDVPGASGITVTPSNGEGEVVSTIALDENQPPGDDVEQVQLTAHGVWKGKEATETITVRVGGGYRMKIY